MGRSDSLPLRQKPTEREKFIAWVLWLHGMSAGQIGILLGKSRKSALSICQKSEYSNRAAMALTERQVALDELRMIRCDETTGEALDNGLLPDRVFVARPLKGRQIK